MEQRFKNLIIFITVVSLIFIISVIFIYGNDDMTIAGVPLTPHELSDDNKTITTDIYFYTNGTNITRLEVDQRYLRINGQVYMKDFALHDYPVFEEHEIIVIPDDRQPKVYFETKTIERCNEAVLIGDKNCYNHSYLEIHLLVDSDTAQLLSIYGYYSIPDLSDYEIVYSEEMY